MSPSLAAVLFILLTSAVVLAILSRRHPAARLATALLLLGFAGLCAFGYLASAELGADAADSWRIGYATLGAVSLSGSCGLFAWAIRSLRSE